ncbi:uncharacterized protein LOC8270444 [Ricinus communis]|uniref:uncharacterized protein LOC8270444 n=1 Tax=Ricinus communis TaxID=3988 RepID=UPI00201A8C0D|nr:uncharacterized protein LOC8270444 [Ricinus communis]XP_015579464.2 uncharacterized protein LOC8270444 [Ricinus communis]
MGLEGLQSLHLPAVPHSPSSCRKPFCTRSYSLSSFRCLNNHQPLSYSLGRPSTLFGSCGNLKTSGLKRSCSADSNAYFDEEFLRQIEDLAQKFDVFDHRKDMSDNDAAYSVSKIENDIKNITKNREKTDSAMSMSFLPSKLESLEPSFLGIVPEPPEWPEREEIVKMSIQRKANSVDIPLSLRMIRRKQKCREGFVDAAGDFEYCSVNKAFSSMVFMIREIQNHALSIRGGLYSEDLQAVVNKFQKEMNASFVWLFQQVFSRTPNLMVYVMLLLANFTVHSMVGNLTTGPSERICCRSIPVNKMTTEELNREHSTSIQYTSVGSPGYQEMTEEEEEMELWNMVVKEAALLQEEESRYPVLDQETMKQFVSPISVEIEPDDYAEFHRTDILYQMGVAEDPDNTLLLSNYAQFLYKVCRDYDRAEECFKRAIMSGPPDAETFSRYADFLWLVRKDLWNAEEVYQQALEAAPDNHYYLSKYAKFLWSTGGEDTCFPLSFPSYKVM